MQLEEYLERDDRVVLPLGSTEQHAYLSLETDNVLAERIAFDAAEPLGVPVLPALGFRRILIVNGHGGNTPARSRVVEWHGAHPDAEAIWHDWWSSPEVAAVANSFDPVWSHASWSENFPWTRLDGVELPREPKEPVRLPLPSSPEAARRAAGDGSFGGRYERPDEEVLEVWRAGVEGARALLESGWTRSSSRRKRTK
jgi:creatinine amidohydrolase